MQGGAIFQWRQSSVSRTAALTVVSLEHFTGSQLWRIHCVQTLGPSVKLSRVCLCSNPCMQSVFTEAVGACVYTSIDKCV